MRHSSLKARALCFALAASTTTAPLSRAGDLPAGVLPRAEPYNAAVDTRVWIDPSRPTPANGRAPALPQRTFKVDVVYPKLAGAHHLPLIVFVHGLNADRRSYNYLTRSLARAGYVVVAADLPLTAGSTRGGASDAHSDEQARDLSFLVDRLSDPRTAAEPWAKLVDPSRYVVVGQSTGGSVALVAGFSPTFHDRRVAGVIALSPNACFFSPEFFKTRKVPLAIIGTTNDKYAPFINNAAWAYTASEAPHAIVTLLGGNHVYETDYCFPDWLVVPFFPVDDRALIATMAPYGPGTAVGCGTPQRSAALSPMSCGREHALIRNAVAAFSDEMLLGDPGGVKLLVGRHGARDHGPLDVALDWSR